MNACCLKCGDELTLHYVEENGKTVNHDFEMVCPSCGVIYPSTPYRRPLTANKYQAFAARTINRNLCKKDQLINGVMGMCGEAGEAIDIVKKHLAQGHPLDKDLLIKELGDVAWYLAETATALDVTLEDVLLGNIDKLKARYPEGFDPEKNLHRREGDV